MKVGNKVIRLQVNSYAHWLGVKEIDVFDMFV